LDHFPARSIPLTPAEIACFQALVKPAIVYLLLLRLNRPVGARELADILGLDEHTVAKYLRMLGKLHLVVRTRHRGGYQLAGDHQRFFSADLIVNKLQFEPATSVNKIYQDQKNKQTLTAVEVQDRHEISQLNRPSADNAAALQLLGIGEPKRSSLACLPHITPGAIRRWHAHLRHVKGDDYRPGLLIHVLETGDPPPEISDNGHPLDCACNECAPLICPQCCTHPCDCETD